MLNLGRNNPFAAAALPAAGSTALPAYVYCGGAAWGCAYFLGVYRALWTHFGPERLARVTWLGDSAGALLALGMSLGRTPDELDTLYTDLAAHASVEPPE